MVDLDLETGDEEAAESVSSSRRRRRAAARGSSDTPKSESKSNDGDLLTRIVKALEKVADQIDARDDTELATAVREESKPMASGLVSLTKSVTPLRTPLVLFVELLEPVLAFFRVGRILTVRWFERRQAAAEAYDEANNSGLPPDAVMVNP